MLAERPLEPTSIFPMYRLTNWIKVGIVVFEYRHAPLEPGRLSHLILK